MGKAAALRRKIDKVLNKVNAGDRVAYKRVYTRTGGDELIGRPGSVTHVDTPLNPKPSLQPVTQESLAALSGSTKVQLNDIVMTVSSTALTRAEFGNKNLSVVLKAGTAEEEYSIEAFIPSSIEGTALVFSALLRSKKQ